MKDKPILTYRLKILPAVFLILALFLIAELITTPISVQAEQKDELNESMPQNRHLLTSKTGTISQDSTRIPVDECEDNFDFDTACLIGVGDSKTFSFVPLNGDGPDNDFFKVHLKEGAYVYCETSNLSPTNDTNMIVFDTNRQGIGGNDDIDGTSQNLASGVDFFAPTTGL
ncbi:MAG: hypothetical protein AAF633_27405 [Chloroflexota bacterium]